MKAYVLTLISLIILFVLLSFDEAQIFFAMITFGLGAVVALVVVNALALIILAFPAIMTGKVAGTTSGWAVFGVLVIALMFGPGLVRRHLAADLNDAPPSLTDVLTDPAQTIELSYLNGYVAHSWSDGQLAPKHNATPQQDIVALCDALCSGLLSLEGVSWVQIKRPNLAAHRLRLDADSSRIVFDEMRNDGGPDVSISLDDRRFPQNKTSALQIWSGLQHKAARKVVDHREADRVVLERDFYSYSGVDDLVFFFPTLSTSLGSGIEGPWNWSNKRFQSDPKDMPDLASDLAAIGLPIPEANTVIFAAGTSRSFLKMQVDALLSQPIIPGSRRIEPFLEVDRLTITRFVDLLGDAEPNTEEFDTALALFHDPRNFEKHPILNVMARSSQAASFVAAILKTNQTSNVETEHYDLFKKLDDTQSRAVWRILDADIGLPRLFDDATNRQRAIYMSNLDHMEGNALLLFEKAMALAMDTQPTSSSSDAPIGTTYAISRAFGAATRLPTALHSQAIPLIVGWLDRNIDTAQAERPNCHFLVADAIKALDQIGGYLDADRFLKRHNVTCPKR